MINVLLVDDSAVIRAILKQILGSDQRFKIIGEASNGEDAVMHNSLLHPDLIIMDINMPVMDGIQATREIMKKEKTAIVMFSTEDSARYGFEAINAGAVEMFEKPSLSSSTTAFYNDFREKLFLIASQYKKTHRTSVKTEPLPSGEADAPAMIMIGASTGGPMAVQTVLKGLGNITVPVFLTQHIDASFAKHYTPWLAETTGLPVTYGMNGEECVPGHVYVAPADYHMTVDYCSEKNCYKIWLNQDPSVHYMRPAVDPMFISGAQCAGRKCIAVLLTGMGSDGAEGCVKLKKAGGLTICESEDTCAVYGMPKAAIEKGGAQFILPVDEIGGFIRKLIRR